MPDLIERVAALAAEKKIMLAIAESCTGGLLSAAVTARAGSSSYFERGFITYSNEAKIQMLDLDARLIEEHGAVSEETAKAMAHGAVRNSRADVGLSVTGIAGPGGGSEAKPVGLVYIGYAYKQGTAEVRKCLFKGTREAIREQSVLAALTLLIQKLEESA